jgi:hypothetical protein
MTQDGEQKPRRVRKVARKTTRLEPGERLVITVPRKCKVRIKAPVGSEIHVQK